MKKLLFAFVPFLLFLGSCSKALTFTSDFNDCHDRIWIGRDYWTIPLEDWKISEERVECVPSIRRARMNLLTRVLSPVEGDFELSVNMGALEPGNLPGPGGFLIGLKDSEDPDVRASCYFGTGIMAGDNPEGNIFLDDQMLDLPGNFDWERFHVHVSGNDSLLKITVEDGTGNTAELSSKVTGIDGIVALYCEPAGALSGNTSMAVGPGYWFDDFHLSGSKVEEKPENAFGPVLWTMHTMSANTLKMMAFLPPLGEEDNQEVGLQLQEDGKWKTLLIEVMEPDSRTVVFRIENWDATVDRDYRVQYTEKGKNGRTRDHNYEGTIRREPLERPLKLGGFTCQFHYGFPYTPLAGNVEKLDPDMLYFSGDQIYEQNGGYAIKREPAELSILSYLGKYYMFGWAFGDLMRDRPTVCTPDDHDVFHGNLWGEGGVAKPQGAGSSDTKGFMQSVRMVNVVNRTQCGHLPDPYDPSPIHNGMSVWYTGLTYGRVSFAIVSDRVFKSGPERISDWPGRKDHLLAPVSDRSKLDRPNLKLLGDRQMSFLEEWIRDWKGSDMKVLLSQTVFSNVATHHGSYEGYLYGDLDSGGWPKSARDRAIRLMRKAHVFHINGDQHLPSLVQYGIDDYRDAGWSFCTPAITVGYQRWFRPDELGIEHLDRPGHGNPNTGKYQDAFGNKNYVYAIANPGKIRTDDSRYTQAEIRSSGFGLITFDQKTRDIHMDAWRFNADVETPGPSDQFPGWPLTINQLDNYGRPLVSYLPTLEVAGETWPVVEVIEEKNGELVYIYRMKDNKFLPGVYSDGVYTIRVIETLSGEVREFTGLPAVQNNPEVIQVAF